MLATGSNGPFLPGLAGQAPRRCDAWTDERRCSVVHRVRGVAIVQTEDDELVVADCDLDATAFGKTTVFDFARHRRIEHYGRITGQTGVMLSP
jgi:hypothetical protein